LFFYILHKKLKKKYRVFQISITTQNFRIVSSSGSVTCIRQVRKVAMLVLLMAED